LRAEALGGRLTVSSPPGLGTTLRRGCRRIVAADDAVLLRAGLAACWHEAGFEAAGQRWSFSWPWQFTRADG